MTKIVLRKEKEGFRLLRLNEDGSADAATITWERWLEGPDAAGVLPDPLCTDCQILIDDRSGFPT